MPTESDQVVAPLSFGLLGPVTVWRGGAEVELGGPCQRRVLAKLLLDVGQVVAVSDLVDAVWDEAPPSRARNALQVYVSQLRQRLAGVDGVGLEYLRPGYRLAVPAEWVDLNRFRALVTASRSESDPRDVAALLRQALGLWRGPALADVSNDWLRTRVCVPLDAERTDTLVTRIEAELALGQHRELVPELAGLAAEHPLSERVHQLLMLALHRDGRSPEALAVFRKLRHNLVEELAVEPKADLQRLHSAILGNDPELMVPTGSGWPGTPAERTAPVCQLPRDPADFVGRQEQLEQVRGWLLDVAADQSGPRTLLVHGTPGVGKTSLVLRLAHQVRPEFPDGQLHAVLRAGSGHRVDPGEVLASFLRALGVPGNRIPDELEERSRLYRSYLADRRMLVVLDDAGSEHQIRPLLPGAGRSAVLVTSRGRMSGLEGMPRLELDVLSEQTALELLQAVAGADVSADPGSARTVAALCGRLPLALRIAAARIATRPDWTLARLAVTLEGEHRRLDVLRAGDLEVRASLELSYQSIDDGSRRALRYLGLLDQETFPGWVLAALLGAELADGDLLLEQLVDVHLVEVVGMDPTGSPRYRLHDLLRLYARERVLAEEAAADRSAALERLCGGYLELAYRADQGLPSGFLDRSRWWPTPWEPPTGLADQVADRPLEWFQAERTSLCGLVETAVDAGLARLASGLAACLASFLENNAYLAEWMSTHQLALEASRRFDDRYGGAVLLRNLGEFHTVQDRYDQAAECFQAAADLFAQTGDAVGGAAVAAGTAMLHRLRGRHRQGLLSGGSSLELARSSGSHRTAAYVLHQLGTIQLERGDLPEAERRLRESEQSALRTGYLPGQAMALRGLALVHRARDEWEQALACAESAMRHCADVDDLLGNTHAKVWYAHLRAETGATAEATGLLQECLDVYQETGNRFGTALTLRNLADVRLAAGSPKDAVELLGQAVRLWTEIEAPYWLARAQDLLVHAYGLLDAGVAAATADEAARGLRAGLDLDFAALRAADPYRTVTGVELLV